MAPPGFDESLGFLEGIEDLPVQEFVAQSGNSMGSQSGCMPRSAWNCGARKRTAEVAVSAIRRRPQCRGPLSSPHFSPPTQLDVQSHITVFYQ